MPSKIKSGQSKTRPGDGLPYEPTPHRIALEQAVALTQRFRRSSPSSEKGGFFYGVEVQALLSQPGCTGMRFYHGLDETGKYRLVLVGVDAEGNDIGTSSRAQKHQAAAKPTKGKAMMKAMSAESGAVILDSHWPCPPFCNGGDLA